MTERCPTYIRVFKEVKMRSNFKVRVEDPNIGIVFEKTFFVRTENLAKCRMCQWLMKNNVDFGDMIFSVTEVKDNA